MTKERSPQTHALTGPHLSVCEALAEALYEGRISHATQQLIGLGLEHIRTSDDPRYVDLRRFIDQVEESLGSGPRESLSPDRVHEILQHAREKRGARA